MVKHEQVSLGIRRGPVFQRHYFGSEPRIRIHREIKTLAVRQDRLHISDGLTRGLLSDYLLEESKVRNIIAYEYDVFQDEALHIVANAITALPLDDKSDSSAISSQRNRSEHNSIADASVQPSLVVDLFEEEALNTRVLNAVELSIQQEESSIEGSSPAEPVALDPLLVGATFAKGRRRVKHTLGISRYSTSFGTIHIERPGMPNPEVQIDSLPQTVILVDDNSKTLKSFSDSASMIEGRRRTVKQGVVGINGGKKSEFVTDSGTVIPIDAVVTYDGEGDIGFLEPRDTLVGPGGAVDRLSDGLSVRLPFPLNDFTKEYGVPREFEMDLKKQLLIANLHFFARLEESLGVQILLKHMRHIDVGTQMYLKEKHNMSHHIPMQDVIRYFLYNLEAFQKNNQIEKKEKQQIA